MPLAEAEQPCWVMEDIPPLQLHFSNPRIKIQIQVYQSEENAHAN
jgi:hypothetical protein